MTDDWIRQKGQQIRIYSFYLTQFIKDNLLRNQLLDMFFNLSHFSFFISLIIQFNDELGLFKEMDSLIDGHTDVTFLAHFNQALPNQKIIAKTVLKTLLQNFCRFIDHRKTLRLKQLFLQRFSNVTGVKVA